MNVTIKGNWPEVTAFVGQVKVNVASETVRLVGDLTTWGERAAKIAAPKDESYLARSIVGEARGMLGSVMVPGAGQPATFAEAATMEFGRRPGAKAPPPEALRGWAGRHGFDLSSTVRDVKRHTLVSNPRPRQQRMFAASKRITFISHTRPEGAGIRKLWLLARSISRKGIVGKHYMEQARVSMVQAMPGMASAALRRMVGK